MDGRELFIRLIRVRVRGNIIPCDRIERLTMNFQNQIRIPQTVGLIRDLGLFYIREYLDRKVLVLLLDGRSILGYLRSFDNYGAPVVPNTSTYHSCLTPSDSNC
ncbi:uncharacterized protein LOC116402709 isoform X3 [Cucumis sativus]|nr:uncharacterized protein LOC116402709 isoform X3 [Cucumis sativus]